MLLEAEAGPEPKGFPCAQVGAFNLHAALRVAPNNKQGKEFLCRSILRPPLAKERLHLLPDGGVTLDFKRPWSDGPRCIGLAPKALLARLTALVPPPKRHVTVYSGVLASNSRWRRWIVPKAGTAEAELEPGPTQVEQQDRDGVPTAAPPVSVDGGQWKAKAGRSRYIPWHELSRRTFGEEVRFPDCGGRLRLVALVKKEETIRAVLTALHFPTVPQGSKSLVDRAPERRSRREGAEESADWPEYPD
jgi:hypothetical protein